MSSRCLRLLTVVWVIAVAGVAFSAPAAAAVTYDPDTKIGFVGRAEVRDAFGWTDAVLAARAPDVVFDHDFWTADTYSVACGGTAFPLVHHSVYGRFDLSATLAHREGRGAPAYGGKLIGFRLAGAVSGISGTSMPPALGEPCPRPEASAATIDRIQLVSSATGWSLAARHNEVSRILQVSPVRNTVLR
jgi:hypothetical protein